MKSLTKSSTLVMVLWILIPITGTSQVSSLTHKIDSLLARELNDELPGGAITVLSNKGILYKNSIGITDIERNQQIDGNTLFDLASVSKQFTAFAIMILEQEGRIDLDADIRTYLPNLRTYDYKVTVRHLLQHTGGIASTDWLRLIADLPFDEVWYHDDEIEILARYSQLNFKPNSRFIYSNGGYALLASIVEEVSGISFGDFLKHKIFMPLGMETALVFSHPSTPLTNDAKGYRVTNGLPVKVSSTTDFSYGSGNVWATMDDMIKWARNFFSPVVGSAGMINKIKNRYNTLENGDSIIYTYGFYVRSYKGIKMADHQGGMPGFRNYFIMFPDDSLIIIASFNNESLNASAIVNGISDLLLAGKIIEQQPRLRVEVALNSELTEAFAGTYEFPDGMELSFKTEQDTFWVVLPGERKYQLFAEDEYNFFLKDIDANCRFIASEPNEVNNVVWTLRGRPSEGSRVTERIPLGVDEIKLFAGRYSHPDLRIEYPVLFEDGALYLQTPSTFRIYMGVERLTLTHVSGDRFLTSGFGILEFTRDEDGKLDGFIMPELGRLQNVRFIRGEI